VNDGKGRFTKRSLSVTGDRGYGIGIADFDADGDLDLAVGNDRPDPKLLYFNDGRGQFTQAGAFGDPAWPTRTSLSPISMAIGVPISSSPIATVEAGHT
jgi:hypothetical protein